MNVHDGIMLNLLAGAKVAKTSDEGKRKPGRKRKATVSEEADEPQRKSKRANTAEGRLMDFYVE